MPELIDRGSVKLRYSTVAKCDFQRIDPQPRDRYFLVSQVFTKNGDYVCTQLLGIDLRAVKNFERQGFGHIKGIDLSMAERERIQSSLELYARWTVNQIANALTGPASEHSVKIQ